MRPVGSTSGRPRVGAPDGARRHEAAVEAARAARPSRLSPQAAIDRTQAAVRSSRAPRAVRSRPDRPAARPPPARRQQLQPLDRVAGGAPRRRRRPPAARRAAAAAQGCAEVARQRIETEAEIGGERAVQRGVLGPPRPSAAARAIATSRASRLRAVGARPNTCSPSRICSSFRSHRWASSVRSASVTGASRAEREIGVEPLAAQRAIACRRRSPRRAADRGRRRA